MSSSREQLQFEGTWEDIVRRGNQLAGKRVRVTVLAEEADQERLRAAALELIDQAVPGPDPNRPPLRGRSAEFANAVADKLRKQGIS
jgi:hypothetical protein